MKKLASITIRVTQEHKEFLVDTAEYFGESLSEFLRQILPKGLKE